MNNNQDSTSNFLVKLDKYNINKLGGSSDTIVLCAYLDEEDEENKKEENEEKEEKITYVSFKNHRSKPCIIL